MAGKTEIRREKLRKALLEIAERRIAENGYRALTARELASEAGCAVGAIYNIFKDMDALVADVNSRTGARLEQAVAEAFAQNAGASTPKRQLVLLGRIYLSFVVDNPLLWSAIFEHAARMGTEFAERREAENARLIGHIVRPLKVLLPDSGEERLVLVGAGAVRGGARHRQPGAAKALPGRIPGRGGDADHLHRRGLLRRCCGAKRLKTGNPPDLAA